MASPAIPDNEQNPPFSTQTQTNTPPGEVQTTIIIIDDNDLGYGLRHNLGFEEQIIRHKFIW